MKKLPIILTAAVITTGRIFRCGDQQDPEEERKHCLHAAHTRQTSSETRTGGMD